MADNPTRLYGPAQPGTSNGTLYTATGVTTIVQSVTVVNTTASAATLSLAINGTAATAANNWLFAVYSVPANGFVHVPCWEVLEDTHTIQGLQGTGSALTVTISGVEVS